MAVRLTLYLAGNRPEYGRLGVALRGWCDRELGGGYRLDVVDVEQWPALSGQVPVLAVPALTLDSSGRTVIGDLSDIPAAMAALGLVRK